MDRIIPGVKTTQERIYPGIFWPRPIYTPEYYYGPRGYELA